MFVVAGVSGNTGSVVAETLLSGGKKVRVIVRDPAKGAAWAKRGAEVAVADLGDVPALTKAFEGAQGAYLLLPPTPQAPDLAAAQEATTTALVAAATASRLPHVVLLSSVGAHQKEGTGPIRGLHVAEEAFAAAKIPLTAIRAAYFAENWGASLGGLASGTLPTFLTADQRIPMVATVDIGKTAAAALLEGPRGTKSVVELAGPEDASPRDVAKALEALTGKTITVAEGPLSAVVPTFMGFGLGRSMAEAYREMIEGVQKGVVAFEGNGTRLVRGTTTVGEVLKGLLGRANLA